MGTVKKGGREYWNSRAQDYPRYKEGEDGLEAWVLRLAHEHGVDFKGKSVLDVGCGSGKFTIRIAREAASVLGTDISDEMLRILKEDAEAQGLANIECVCAGWDAFASEQKFDSVFASMTPAVASDENRQKLMDYALDEVVYVGFDEHMLTDVLRGLFDHYKVQTKRHNDVTNMRAWLDAKGLPYTAVPVRGTRTTLKSRADVQAACIASLQDQGVTPDAAFLETYLEAFRQPSGQYAESTDYNLEILIWKKS